MPLNKFNITLLTSKKKVVILFSKFVLTVLDKKCKAPGKVLARIENSFNVSLSNMDISMPIPLIFKLKELNLYDNIFNKATGNFMVPFQVSYAFPIHKYSNFDHSIIIL